jgi:hypothetical protein
MTDAVIKGEYSDFKLVKTRNVVQMIIEVPIEQATQITERFGIPTPTESCWVAVAKLDVTKNEVSNKAIKAIQQAGILGQDIAFGTWLKTKLPEIEPNNIASIQQGIRTITGVRTRADFKTDSHALEIWQKLHQEYENYSK